MYRNIFIKYRLTSQRPLPESPKIYAINHPTATDPFIIGSLFPNARILITKDAFSYKFSNLILKKLNHIPVDGNKGIVAFNEARKTLNDGKDIIIFPEGSLSKDVSTMNRLRSGLVRLALETKATIIPIGVNIKKEGVKKFPFTLKSKRKVLAKWYLFNKYFVNIGRSIRLKGDYKDRNLVRKKSLYLQMVIQNLSRKYFYNTKS
jgi:1-acyl-sn-glycerol-3-phosphate acyltransferase